MQILSLFDGMACGMLAMQSADISVDRYVAFEIDKYAVQTSSHNFPMIEHRGDVFKADFTEFRGFDFLVGGSPCTYWSIAQKNNRETEASGMGWELFSQYVRALHEAQPKFFIYENNKSMSKAIRASIDEAFGFDAVCINSALVSAQNRQRLYWVGKRNPDGTYSKVHVEQPEDRGILLRDVLETGANLTSNDKSYCLTASYDGACAWNTIERSQRTMIAEPVRIPEYGNSEKSRPLGANYSNNCGGFEHRMFSENPNKQQIDMIAQPVNTTEDGKWVKRYESNEEPKANALTTAQTDSMVSEPVYIGEVPGHKGEYRNGKQPSQQYRVYSVDGKSVACDTDSRKHIAQPVCEPVRVGTWPNNAKNQAHDSQQYRIYSTEGKGVTLCGNGGGMGAKTGLYAIACRKMPVREATKKGYTEIEPMECVDMTQPNSKTRRGRNMADKSNCCMTSCQHYQYCGVLGYATPCEWDEDGNVIKAISAADGKEYPVYEVKDGQITIKGKSYPIKLVDGFYIIRKLTVTECKRLQTVPEWYEFPVSDTQAYKMLGNGWTVEVIAHLINATQADVQEEEQLSLFRM